MSKLAAGERFLDLSDYGRSAGKRFAGLLKNTRFTPIHVTMLFGVCGLAAVCCILRGDYLWAGVFLILKSIIDAADGELSRVKNTPSYSGRYLDSIFDIVLNFLILMAIGKVSATSPMLTLLAFICMQLQGTLYNYYYVILRNNTIGGDSTSKVFEDRPPVAFPGERQRSVDVLFSIYSLLYGAFDRAIYLLDKGAHRAKPFPKWFMTCLSIYGLGFQLLLIAVMLATGLIGVVVPFFVFYSVFIFVLAGVRRGMKA